ncbi:DUF937 domain-containing protein [Chryseobacterium sp. T1]
MSFNLIDLVKNQISPALISQTASQLGESESGVSKAISGLLPAVVGGLANNASNPSVFATVKEVVSSGLVNNLLGGSGQNNNLVSTILSLIFGDKTNSLTSAVANFAGVSQGSSNSILNLLTGSTLGTLGKYVSDNNVDHSQFSNLLSDQKGVVSSLLPAGLSLATLGLGNWFGDSSAEHVKVQDVVSPVETNIGTTRGGDTYTPPTPSSNNNGGGSIWKWLLPLILLLAAGWFLWKQCEKKAEHIPVSTTDSLNLKSDSATANVNNNATVTRESLVVTLPSGKTINAYKGGIEDQIVTFLKSDEYKNDTEAQLKEKWFNFDNLNFEFGKKTLTPESQVQLDNLKAILAEFPAANVKIGAYTDKKGDAAVNLKLSQDRADVVKAALASAQVKEAKGYGSEFAKVSADASDKERESDRKTAIRFVK